MSGSEMIRYMLAKRNMTIRALAEGMGKNYRTFRNKLTLNNFSFDEMIEIADYLNFDLQAIDRLEL